MAFTTKLNSALTIKTANTNSYKGSAIGELCIHSTDNSIKVWNGNGWTDFNAVESNSLTDTLIQNFSVLENYLKPIVFKENESNYDKILDKSEFIALVKNHIESKTDMVCFCSFYKEMLIETLSITLNNSSIIKLTNNGLLSPDLFLNYNEKFYINTQKFLDVLTKTIFNALLNI